MIIFLFFGILSVRAQIREPIVTKILNENGSICSESSAVPIVFNDMDSEDYKSYYKKPIEKTPFVCNLGEEYCDSWWRKSSNWTTKTAVEMKLNELITDERWHYLSVFDRQSGIKKILDVPEKLQLPMSLIMRTGGTAFYFCSKSEFKAHGNKCVGLYLKSRFVTILKCSAENPGKESHCREVRSSALSLDFQKWDGFILGKDDKIWMSHLTINRDQEFVEDMLFEHVYDDMNLPELKYLIADVDEKSFIKIHNYKFLVTTEPGFYEMGKPFSMSQKHFCFVLYVTMCKYCRMQLHVAGTMIANLTSDDGIRVPTIRPESNDLSVFQQKWRRIEIEINTNQLKSFYNQLYVRTIGHGYWKQNNFWALDFLSNCEGQTIMLPENKKCEYVHPLPTFQPQKKYVNEFWKDTLEKNLINYGDFIIEMVLITDNEIEVRWKKLNPTIKKPLPLRAFLSCGELFTTRIEKRSIIDWKPCRFYSRYYCAQIPLTNMSGHCRLIGQVHNTTFEYSFEPVLKESSEVLKLSPVRHYSDQNIMELEVSHPSYTDGHLRGFQITYTRAVDSQINLNAFESTFLFENNNLSSQLYKYHLKLDITGYAPCEPYFVHVRAINPLGPGYATVNEDISPPLLPNYVKIDLDDASAKTAVFFIASKDSYCQSDRNDTISSYLYVLLANSTSYTDDSGRKKLSNMLGMDLKNNSELIYEINLQSFTNGLIWKFVLGDGKEIFSQKFLTLKNKPLQENKPYEVTFVAVNTCAAFLKYHLYHFQLDSTRNSRKNGEGCGTLFWLLLALYTILVIGLSLYVIKHRGVTKLTNIKFKRETTLARRKKQEEYLLPLEANASFLQKARPLHINFKPHHVRDIQSKPIRVVEFENYLKRALSSNDLHKQFESLPKDPVKPCTIGLLPKNKPKNRYNNIVPYDESRVKLGGSEVDEHSYINASFIAGYHKEISYIATQGPKSLTINDFWQMVWENNVKNIIMVVNLEENGQKKVEKYWPDRKEDFQFGKCHVFHHSEELQADYEIRVMRVVCDGVEKKVRHYHFLRWPDQGAPLHFQTLVPFIRRTLEISSKSPIVVHCCSGTAATGVFITCHLCIKKALKTGTLDLLEVAHGLRQQRVKMIDNLLQYKLAHLLVMECLIGLQTVISCTDDLDKFLVALTGPDELRLQMKYLNETDWQNRVLLQPVMYSDTFEVIPSKNKSVNIAPEASTALQLTKYPPSDDSSVYINAVKADGYRYTERYVVTQQPLPNTLNDFCRMIVLRNVEAVISLSEIDPNDKKSCFFWPTEENPEMSPVDFIILKHYTTFKDDYIDKIIVHLFVEGKERKMIKVTVLSLKGWKALQLVPNDPLSLLKLHGVAEKEFRTLTEIVLTCYDGCLASGVYLATAYITDKIHLEKSFDICEAVKIIRRNRKQFISEEKQLVFLYEIAVMYIKGLQDYANFAQEEISNFNVYDYVD